MLLWNVLSGKSQRHNQNWYQFIHHSEGLYSFWVTHWPSACSPLKNMELVYVIPWHVHWISQLYNRAQDASIAWRFDVRRCSSSNFEGSHSRTTFFFTSPAIKYAEHYAEQYNFTASDQIKYLIKVVVQCKQKPGTFSTQGKTVSSMKNVCSYVPDDSLEWKTEHRSSIVPYGLLLRIKSESEDKVQGKIDCPTCKVASVFTLPYKDKTINVICSNGGCSYEFEVKYCPNCSQLNVCTAERKKVFVCSNENCSKRYELLLQRRRKWIFFF